MPSPFADSLPLLLPSAPGLVGIARLAALGESICKDSAGNPDLSLTDVVWSRDSDFAPSAGRRHEPS